MISTKHYIKLSLLRTVTLTIAVITTAHTAEGLLEEINEYNPNPTKEMVKLRDFYILLLKSEPS